MDVRLIEEYGSIQGEGLFAGYPTYFIRFAGCALQCSWCDTPYSWGPGHKFYTVDVDSLTARVSTLPYRHVCITGGEPLLQADALAKLVNRDKYWQIETGGDQPVLKFAADSFQQVSVCVDYKLAGSGMTHKMLEGNFVRGVLGRNDSIKFVVAHPEDFDEAVAFLKTRPYLYEDTNIFFQALGAFEKSDGTQKVDADGTNMWNLYRWLADKVMELKLPVRVNFQVHKALWNPFERER